MKKLMDWIPFLLILSLPFFTVIACRDPNPFQKQLMSIKDEIKDLEVKNKQLDDLYEKATRAKKSMIERKINLNKKKIKMLTHKLTKLSKGTQKRVLNSISREAKKRNAK